MDLKISRLVGSSRYVVKLIHLSYSRILIMEINKSFRKKKERNHLDISCCVAGTWEQSYVNLLDTALESSIHTWMQYQAHFDIAEPSKDGNKVEQLLSLRHPKSGKSLHFSCSCLFEMSSVMCIFVYFFPMVIMLSWQWLEILFLWMYRNCYRSFFVNHSNLLLIAILSCGNWFATMIVLIVQ